MNVIKRLAYKNLKMNKKRTISTIIGIILSVSLICGTATLVTSIQKTLVQNAINETGYYHIKLKGVKEEEEEKLKSNRDIKEMFYSKDIGYGTLEGCTNESKPYVKLHSIDKEYMENFRFKLKEGRFAENNNEIVIGNHIISNGGLDLKIGDKLKLEIGDRKTLDGDNLTGNNPFLKDEGEKIVNTKTYDFTIVGIIERPDYSFEDYSDPGYTVLTSGINGDAKDIYVTLNKPSDYKISITEMLRCKKL